MKAKATLLRSLFLAGFLFFFHNVTSEVSAQMPEGGPPPAMPVKVEIITPARVEIWKEFSGRIQAVDYVQVKPQVGGKIVEVRFKDGAHVKAGDILFVIDKRTYEAAVNKAKADLESARNRYVLADSEWKRAQELVKTDALSQRVFDERRSARQVSLSEMEASKAALEQAQINLDYATITAPVSGFTSRAEVTVGNLVDASFSAPVLTTIVSDKGVYADFEVDEKTYIQHIRLPDGHGVNEDVKILLTVPNIGDEEIEGKIHSFDNRIDPASGTIRARAFFPNSNAMLIPGMLATVKVGTKAVEEKILIPETAIGTDQNRKFVMIADAANKAAYRPVTLGETTQGRRVVLEGVQAGDKLIVEGLMMLRPDMDVVPQVVGENQAQTPAGAQETPKTAGEMPVPATAEENVEVIKH